ncbi:hypothetical protein Cadr_000000994 [Camelus dromedarius]|uniref:Uncharacterized protein n=1 Tax=Camelus dromedarius TaxID=9838 RepID=A0A5N4EIV4_CAMDR|nr:hypothetical protein Cadr_000000994 [Camelus dromedarius]
MHLLFSTNEKRLRTGLLIITNKPFSSCRVMSNNPNTPAKTFLTLTVGNYHHSEETQIPWRRRHDDGIAIDLLTAQEVKSS